MKQLSLQQIQYVMKNHIELSNHRQMHTMKLMHIANMYGFI